MLSTDPIPPAAQENGGLQPPGKYARTDLSSVFFSSGSTGQPKGVQHSANIWMELIGSHVYDPFKVTEAEAAEKLLPVSWSDSFWHGAITWYSTWGVVADMMHGKQVAIITKTIMLDAPLLRTLPPGVAADNPGHRTRNPRRPGADICVGYVMRASKL